MIRSRPSKLGDAGASLIIALMFVTGVGLVVTALLTYSMGGLSSAKYTGQAAQSAADASGAMQSAINDVRNSTYNNGGTPCLATGDRRTYPSLIGGGTDTTVTCSPEADSGLGGGVSAPINAANRPPASVLTLGTYGGGAMPGTLPADPSAIVVTPNAGKAGSAVIVSGSNIADATAIQIGTTAEILAATGTTLSPCPGGVPAAGCFTTSGTTLAISSMPAHAIGAVQVKVITLGTSSSGAFSYQVIPSAPVAPTATAGAASATVSWTAPADGGSPITSYVITPYRVGVVQAPITVAASPTSTTISGLSIGVSYTFTVTAVNAIGTGPASPASNAVTPVATVPGAPTIGTATAGTLAATVRWTAPASDGGAAVNGYVVTPYIGAVAQPATTFASTVTTQIVTGLTAGATYTFKVSARNSIGIGAQSAASNAVTINAAMVFTFGDPPVARYGQPYNFTFTKTGGTAPFVWAISVGTLPPGLTLNTTTGVVSGSTSVWWGQSYDFTVRVTDVGGAAITKATTIDTMWTSPQGIGSQSGDARSLKSAGADPPSVPCGYDARTMAIDAVRYLVTVGGLPLGFVRVDHELAGPTCR